PDVTLHVQDTLEINFEMPVGIASDSVTVEGGAPLVNTESAAVSTLIDRRFVENLPLNGRSFGSLLDLTPGVVLTPSNFQEQGQFSVNGQRPDANYFMVDGVAANLGTSSANLGQGGAGQLPVTSAFGGMSNLVSLDALQEFRIQTSTFAPEFGRAPGAQVSVVTRSGTNAYHGTAFEYFRNDMLDANNWFANNKGLGKAALRQNDFGGVFGGPIKKDTLFFFASYEGVRVRQPKVANTYVPSLATIQSAPAAVQPLLNAFPKPNGPDQGNGTAAFVATYSDPSTLDSYSGRIDYLLSSRVTMFGRYSDAPSSSDLRSSIPSQALAYNTVLRADYHTQTATVGSDQVFTSRLTNEVRFNYSRSRSYGQDVLDNFGGGVVPSPSVLFPLGNSLQDGSFLFFGDSNPFGLRFVYGNLGTNVIQQFNVTDAVSHTIAAHALKFGVDYRRLSPEENTVPYQLQFLYRSLANVLANKAPSAFIASRTPSTLVFPNWSLYAQDAWKATPSFTVTFGVRWDYNGAPSSPNGTLPFTVSQVANFSTMTLAPAGTPLWSPQKDDFAPRLGLAWQALPNLVVRAGGGIFYDLGYSQVANGSSAFPFAQSKTIPNVSFPLSAASATPPPFTTSPPAGFLEVVDPNHVLPRTYEWNAAVEQNFGSSNVLSLTYVGAAGRKLMRHDIYLAPNPNVATGEFDVLSNAATSNYNALQGQFRHRLSHGMQTLISYTWSHSIDDVSTDGNFQNIPLSKTTPAAERASSDFDIRQTFSAAVSYDIPAPANGILRQIFGRWSTDSIIYARSAPPVNIVTGVNPFGALESALSGINAVQRPDVVPGVPFYLNSPTAPGGKVINKAAFTTPAAVQGNLGRNALRGFGATQWDLTLRRQFRFTERLALQARSDFFNVLNHPNFGSPISFLTSPQFGQATQMLNGFLGSGGQNGGLNPLYQIGGPRSIQLALKLQF
ncbi:MAG TPA: TonB-dependent receptor, partial [Terriglobales bacterium]|nr:TonB-dependent receptor [Terriglobales bacterium]